MTRRHLTIAVCLAGLVAAGAIMLYSHHVNRPAGVSTEASSATCEQCHAAEVAGYARTGMAHAFSVPDAAVTVDAPAGERVFHHTASGTNFSLVARDGKYFQRRWLTGFDGRPDDVEELQIDYVMGSGNHARTYLHREPDGTLIELPLAWYAESGGRWGMNPGFDNAHPMTRRAIAYECMFCHNAYPQIPATTHRDLSAEPVYTGSLPTGIDCARCHGPGGEHVRAARAPGSSLELIRSAILNPARLSNSRQMEVCAQCHLETTSRLLPDRIRHYDREPFDYTPDQPLASFNSYFERDPASGRTDNFEIVSAPYRLRQSRCYLKSQGTLTCETCHNPHDLHKGPESATYYTGICMKCHAAALPAIIAANQHTASKDCVSCHMPKRRTDDVVHVVMTDHLIQKKSPTASSLLAARAESPDGGADAYHGLVKPYLLDQQSSTDSLYEAAAQVIDGSNVAQGISTLQALIEERNPRQPNFSIELGDALRHNHDVQGAISAYRRAAALDPLSSRAERRLGVTLGSAGELPEALTVLQAQTQRTPGSALLWYEQSLVEFRSRSVERAIQDVRRALALKPDFADAQDHLGTMLVQTGDMRGAEAAFRAALAVNPYDAATRANLGRLLGGRNDWLQAAFQFAKAIALDPANADAHADYATSLLQLQRPAEALTQAGIAVSANPKDARLHYLLGNIFAQQRETTKARRQFEAALAIDADYGPAQIDLALTLLAMGDVSRARTLLDRAQQSAALNTRERAASILRELPLR